MKHRDARRRYFATPELRTTIRRQGRFLGWVADQIGVSQGHFTHILNGRRPVSGDDARMIATILGADFFSLWKVSDDTGTVSESPEAIAS